MAYNSFCSNTRQNKQPLAGQKSNINKPVIDETTLFDYPVLVSFPRKRKSRPANAGFKKSFF